MITKQQRSNLFLSIGLIAIVTLFYVGFTGAMAGNTQKKDLVKTEHRYDIVPQIGEHTIAKSIVLKDTLVPKNDGTKVTVQAAYFTCPCGRTNFVLPPYRIDTIK